MAYLKGTLTKLGTRTAYYTFPIKRRIRDRLIPWWPFVWRQRHETKHYYVLKKKNGEILKTFRLPAFDYIWTWVKAVDIKEHLLTFTEVHNVLTEGDYDNFKDLRPDDYIGKEIEVWTDVKDHEHYGLRPEHYPFKIEEAKH